MAEPVLWRASDQLPNAGGGGGQSRDLLLGFRVSGFRVWSLGFRVQGLGFGVWGCATRSEVLCTQWNC